MQMVIQFMIFETLHSFIKSSKLEISVSGPLRQNGRPKIALKAAKQRNFDWLFRPLDIGNVINKEDDLKVQKGCQ